MARVLFCHETEFRKFDATKYERIFLIKTFSINFLQVFDNNDKIIYIDLSKYFIKAHKQTRRLNKILLKCRHDAKFISLLKLSDRLLFEYVRNIIIIQELYRLYNFTDIDIVTPNEKLFLEIIEIINISLTCNLHFFKNKSFNLKEMLITRFLYRVVKLNKYLVHFIINNETIMPVKAILAPYYSAQSYINISDFDNESALVYPLASDNDQYFPFHKSIYHLQKNKFVTLNMYKKFFFHIFKSYKDIQETNIPLQMRNILLRRVIDLEFYNILYQSAVEVYKPKVIIGQFDATSYIDYITEKLNDIGVQTMCIPHGINFQYKVNYISHGVNSYMFWSKEHKKQFDKNVLIKNCNDDFIGGFSGFKSLKEKYIDLEDIYVTNKKSILIIGEYFSKDNFYTSPFSYKAAQQLFEKLKEYISIYNISISIRTRINDEYHELALEYEQYGIKISTPDIKDIFTDIMEHDLIVSVFSNALHESLLLRKKTLQVNFLGIENYRNLAQKGLVYYVQDEDELDKFMKLYMQGELNELDFDLHEEMYCNGSKMTLPKIGTII